MRFKGPSMLFMLMLFMAFMAAMMLERNDGWPSEAIQSKEVDYALAAGNTEYVKQAMQDVE